MGVGFQKLAQMYIHKYARGINTYSIQLTSTGIDTFTGRSMPVAASIAAEVDTLYPQLLKRSIEDGEWHRYFSLYQQ